MVQGSTDDRSMAENASLFVSYGYIKKAFDATLLESLFWRDARC